MNDFARAYREARDSDGASVARIEAVWGDLSGPFAAMGMHNLVKNHLHTLFDGIADGYEPTDAEIRVLDNVPECRRAAIELAECAKGPMQTYEGLFPVEGIAVLYGPPKSGKTQWLIDRLFSWESRRPKDTPFTALYLALEGGRPTVASVEGHKGLQGDAGAKHPSRVVVVTPERGTLHLMDADSIKAFADSLKPPLLRPKGVQLSDAWKELFRVESPDVVVLDTFSKALTGEDENSTAVMTQAYAGLEVLREELGARLLIAVHHPSKNGDSPRGSGALPGGADAFVYLTRRGDGDKAVVTVTLKGAKEIPDKVSASYRPQVDEWTDLCKPGPSYPFVRYTPLTNEPKAKPPTSASKPASNPTDAPAGPVKADAPPAPPKAATGPRLRGLPMAAWNELALVPGDRLVQADARERLLSGAVFGAVDSRRRSQTLGTVLAAFKRAGLMVGDHLTNPEQPPPTEG